MSKGLLGAALMAKGVFGAALVTGGASGIGRAAVTLLAQRGFPVVVADIDSLRGEEVADEIRTSTKAQANFFKLDVTNEASWNEAIEFTVKKYGALQVLVNNAGVGGRRVPIQETLLEDYDRVMAGCATSVFLGCRAAAKELFKTGSASVVNISSVLGIAGGTGRNPGYAAAKGAVRTMTKNIAIAWASKGVRVNSIHPGYIDTPMVRKNVPVDDLARLVSLHPLGRLGRPEEIGKAIVFLATDDSSFVTGAELLVDGGFLCQ